MPASILLVDDDAFFRQVVTGILGPRGYRLVAVENATQALEEAARQPFELVITDLVMPGVDGLQLLSRLRERDQDQEVILVSARQDARASLTAVRAGATDFLLKPVDEAELLLTTERCLERAALRRERSRLLDENLEHARLEKVYRRGLELCSNPDLEWLSERLLLELCGLCDAQSGALWVADERGELKLKAYRGLLDRRFLPERIEPDLATAQRLKSTQPWLAPGAGPPVLFLPIFGSGEVQGLSQLSDPLAGRFSAEHLRDAAALSEFAQAALRTARRFLSLQRHGLRDRETAAYNLSYFTDYASKEIYKARRYGRSFSLLTFSLDNLPQLRARLGAERGRRAARGVIRALSRIVRDSDVLAKATEQEFFLLLPETDYFGALTFLRRAMEAAGEEPEVKEIETQVPLGLTGAAAAFPKDGEDFDELVLRCRRRCEERRGSLHRKLLLEGLPFWDSVSLLLGSARSPRLPGDERSEPSRRGKVAATLFEEVQAEVARELSRDPFARGLVYLGGAEVRSDLPIAVGLESVPCDFSARVYLLGRKGDLESHLGLTPIFVESDERMARHQFLFWLAENAAYALIQRRGRGATWGFHTSDSALVEGLVSKLQAEYGLQPY